MINTIFKLKYCSWRLDDIVGIIFRSSVSDNFYINVAQEFLVLLELVVGHWLRIC